MTRRLLARSLACLHPLLPFFFSVLVCIDHSKRLSGLGLGLLLLLSAFGGCDAMHNHGSVLSNLGRWSPVVFFFFFFFFFVFLVKRRYLFLLCFFSNSCGWLWLFSFALALSFLSSLILHVRESVFI